MTHQCHGKTRYATREAAVFFATVRLQRAYFCRLCNGWHLTTQLKRGKRPVS